MQPFSWVLPPQIRICPTALIIARQQRRLNGWARNFTHGFCVLHDLFSKIKNIISTKPSAKGCARTKTARLSPCAAQQHKKALPRRMLRGRAFAVLRYLFLYISS
jgi:hypothetical protein